MKKTRSIIALIMALAMMFSLCACDGLTEAVQQGVLEQVEQEVENDSYVKGEVTETSWESEYLGMRFECPEGYVMATAEELDQMIEAGGEIVYEDEDSFAIDYAKAVTVYEMSAASEEGIPNVSISVDKIPFGEADVDAYFDAVETQLSELQSDDIQYEIGDRSTAEIDGIEFTVLSALATTSGVTMNQDYYGRVVEDRVMVIIVTYAEEYGITADDILNGFSAY